MISVNLVAVMPTAATTIALEYRRILDDGRDLGPKGRTHSTGRGYCVHGMRREKGACVVPRQKRSAVLAVGGDEGCVSAIAAL